MSTLKNIWGKARKTNLEGDLRLVHHPLICHLIDVAAVAEVFFEDVFSQYLRNQLQVIFSKNRETTKHWLMFIAGIHDLGKATPIFQSKVPELAENLHKIGLKTYSDNKYHSIISGELFYSHFKSGEYDFTIENNFLLNKLRYVIGGHHGVFPKAVNFIQITPDHLGNGLWKEAQSELIKILAEFCCLNGDDSLLSSYSDNLIESGRINALLVFIGGFISVVDWIGSNDYFFNFYSEFENADELKNEYFNLSRLRAKNAIEKIGWANWKYSNEKNRIIPFKEIFPFIKELRPLQKKIIDNLKNFSLPCLTIIEAPMGEGKTEAALYLEHYLEQNKELHGAYIALPTQATANQMFLRIKAFLIKIKQGLRVNLHLLHGNAVISDEYSQLKTNSKNFDIEESNIVADDWFTYRKRGLISPFGVGTIDQLLLSVLPIRHFFVRLFGLAGKIIIIDEVHSYDVYMSTILEWLLYWLRLLGSSVILLSATLPSFKRNSLIQQFNGQSIDINVPYPRITICSESGVIVENFDVALKKQGEESIKLMWVEEVKLPQKIEQIFKNGGRVAIICNKVRRAQDLFLKLKYLQKSGVEVDLLHSRFPFIQRDNIEKNLLEKYGKYKDHRISSLLLISTQIIEQSMDLDFDLMVSDLAPVDLLFQRMGRLHRHTHDKEGERVIRPKNLKRPEFWILKPNLNDAKIPKFTYPIYSRYILLKTFLYLWPVKQISIPDDLEKFIELVYSETVNIPEVLKSHHVQWYEKLERAKAKMEGSEEEKKLSAKYQLIPDPCDEDFFDDFAVYYEENTPEAQQSLQLKTRIIMPSIQLVCLYKLNDELYLDRDGTIKLDLTKVPLIQDAKNILNYSTRISNFQIFKYFMELSSSRPKSWKKNTLTRTLHYVILTKEEGSEDFFFETDKNKVFLKKKLGIYIEKKERQKN